MERSTVKKEARIEVETSEKIWGNVAGVGEFENGGQKPLGPRERAPKIFRKFDFWKKYRKVCVLRSVCGAGGTTDASQHTHFPILLSKIKFSKFFGPFPGAPGAFAHHFRIPLLPLHILKFFPTFRPQFSLPSSRYFHLRLGLVNICFRYKVQDLLYRGSYYWYHIRLAVVATKVASGLVLWGLHPEAKAAVDHLT